MTNELSCEPAATEDFWEGVRHDFPILGQHINGRPLIYLDNAATTQIPMPVLEAIVQHYATSNGNVHRATHTLSARSTCALEQARQFKEVCDITGIVLTKLDGTAKGGIAVAIQAELGIPVKYIGVGESIEDLQKFDADEFVNALFHQEKND